MEKFREAAAKFIKTIAVFIKWVLLASVVGSIVGVMGVLFHFSVEKVTEWQTSYPWLLFLLIPIYYAGLYRGYPVLVTFLFLLAGFGFGWWHPAWLLFLTIPLFYWLYHPHSQEEA